MDFESAYVKAYSVVWKIAVINISLGAVIFYIGYKSNSIALIAFSIDKLLDSLNNVVSVFAIRMASKKADVDHQYGHGKFEVLARFILSMVLFISMFQIIINAFSRLVNPRPVILPNPYELAILIVAMSIIILSSLYMNVKGEETRVKTLTAESYNYLGDSVAIVIVLLGIYFSSIGLPFLDPLIAFFIAGVLIKLGWRIFRESVDILTDRAVVEPFFIENIAKGHEHVREVDEITSRSDGMGIFIEFTLRLNPDLSLDAAHKLAHLIEEKIKESIGREKIRKITIHIEPYIEGKESTQ